MGELVRSMDWSKTPLGSRVAWPQSLRTVVNLVLSSSFPMAIFWGSDLILLYNDAYRAIAADKHPGAMGWSIREVWPEVWEFNKPIVERVMARGETVHLEDQLFRIARRGYMEDAYFTLSYSPIRTEAGQVAGTLVMLMETTRQLTSERLLKQENKALETQIAAQKRAESVIQARLRMAKAAYSGVISADEVLRLMLDELEAQTGSVIGFYHFLEADQETLSLQGWSTNTLETMCTAEGKGRHYNISQAGVWVDCVRKKCPVIHNDYATLPHRKGMPEGHAKVIREMVIPIMRGDRIVAIIGVGNKPTDYNETDIEIASLLGDFSWEIVERRRAEEALRKSQNLLNEMGKIANVGGWEFDMETLELQWTEEVYHIHEVELSYKPTVSEAIDFYAPDSRPVIAQAVQRAIELGEPFDLNLEIITAKGNHRWVQAIGKADREQKTVNGTFQDITERRRMEEAMSQRDSYQKALLDNFPFLVWLKDRNSQFLAVNQPFAKSCGYSSADLLVGKTDLDIWPRDLAEAYRSDDRSVLESGTAKNVEEPIEVEGKRIWFETYKSPVTIDGEVIGSVGFARDITDRKEAEEALREREQRLRFHVENSPMAVVEWDANFKVTRWAGEAQRIFGWSAGETVGKPIMELRIIYEEDIPIVKRTIGRLTSGKERTIVSSNRNYTKSGTVVECVWYNSVLHDGRGQMISVMSLVEDITARRRAEADILKLSSDLEMRNIQLEDANRELEAFIYSVSHDLRAPIRQMSIFAKFLLEDYAGKLDDQGKDYATRISRGSEKMSRLIEDLLDLSRLSRKEVNRSEIDMTALAASVVSGLRKADPGRSVEVTINEGIAASADPSLTEIVLLNLIGNAWKFTSKTARAEIEFGTLEKDGKTVYYVRDNGAGFDAEYAAKMFQPFHRLHASGEFEGTGIGLSIVERIIRRHGGKVWAEGEPGKGATVYFTLR